MPLRTYLFTHSEEEQIMTMIRTRAAVVFATCLSLPGFLAAANKPPVNTPGISCAGGTQVSRSITVCAPSSGAATGMPAGFSLQWMTCDSLAANGGQWFDSDDPRLSKASFSGNANASRYRLQPGECVTVDIGDFLYDAGASTNSTAELSCGTCYAFRAFSHATSTLGRSDFTSNLNCSTLACNSGSQCTFTFSDWRLLGLPCDPGADFFVPKTEVWPVAEVTVGTVPYAEGLASCVLETPANGNGLIALAHQLIAAKLNVARLGAAPSSIQNCISDADALIGGLIVPPIGTGFLDPSATSALTSCLASYNEGAVGPGACLPPDPGEDQ
jgi:hypothetical protein